MSIYDSVEAGIWEEKDFEPYLAACDRIDIALETLRNHERQTGQNKLSEVEIAQLLPIVLAEAQRERQTEILAEIRDAIRSSKPLQPITTA